MKTLFSIPSHLLVWAWLAALPDRLHADDWPQWMGPQRDGVWRERGILERFPEGGPDIRWRVPVHAGYCGPAVASGRVYLMDREAGPPVERKRGERASPTLPGNERLCCLDASTGRQLWEHTYDAPYSIAYPAGPRTTPVVDSERVYCLGAMGDLRCLDTETGELIWSKNFLKDFDLPSPPLWGYAAHPLLDGDRLICLVGGEGSAVVAFNKRTGREEWRALTAKEIGYAPPVMHTIHDRRQLIVWHPDALTGLDPDTGRELWTQKYPAEGKPQRPEVTIATPRLQGDQLFVSSYYQGSLLLRVPEAGASPQIVWDRHSSSKSKFDAGLHTVMCTPVIREGYLYGVCGYGELRCLDLETGDRVWETYGVTGGQAGLFANAFIIPQQDRFFFWNDQGELILGQLSREGFHEISRVKLLETMENTRGRDVLWCHPAFADRCAFMHNGRELICVSLAAQ